jgi:hypothetical protein
VFIDEGGAPASDTDTAPVADPVDAGDVIEPAGDTGGDTDPFDAGADTFDRDYVEKLRRENANYRTKARELEAFAAIHPEDRELLGVVFNDLYSGNEEASGRAAKWLAEQFASLSPAEQAAVEDALEDAAGNDSGGLQTGDLTPEQVQKLIDDALAAKEQEAENAAIEATISAALDSIGLGGDHPHQYQVLRWIAEGVAPDEAVARYETEKAAYDKAIADKAVEEFLARKQGDAAASPTVTDGSAPAAGDTYDLSTREGRAAAAKAYFNSGS